MLSVCFKKKVGEGALFKKIVPYPRRCGAYLDLRGFWFFLRRMSCSLCLCLRLKERRGAHWGRTVAAGCRSGCRRSRARGNPRTSRTHSGGVTRLPPSRSPPPPTPHPRGMAGRNHPGPPSLSTQDHSGHSRRGMAASNRGQAAPFPLRPPPPPGVTFREKLGPQGARRGAGQHWVGS